MKLNLLIILSFCASLVIAQGPQKLTSGQIYESIEKLNFLGNALYVAAHPDDENTRLISYLSNDVNAHTTYLSLTRGDGGQNLIGPEIRELLGLIRTQELLAARRTDGGSQMFTRANDFGYSKNAEETIAIWDDELVKQDVVWAIRNTRPDVIVNRFDHRTSGRTHGHHTASAMLSKELYEAAGDPNVYPEQLRYVEPWKPTRQFFNTSWWFYGSREKFAQADKSNLAEVNVGTYYPLLGLSNNEIAALSRSNHKCQGFGSTGSRGNQTEYLELLNGSMPSDRQTLFEGVNTSWSRVEGGKAVGEVLYSMQENFDHANPSKSVPELMKAYKLVDKVKDPFWKELKKREIEKIIQACLGLYLEAVASDNTAVPGEEVNVRVEAIKRLHGNAVFTGFSISPAGIDSTLQVELEQNEPNEFGVLYTVPTSTDYTSAYWLREEGSLGMYKVSDQRLIGKPETPRIIKVKFSFEIEGTPITFEKDLVNKYNDPEDGEVYRPFEIVPRVSVGIKDKVYVFGDAQPKMVKVEVKAGAANQSGEVMLPLSAGWRSQPEKFEFQLDQKGESQTFEFQIVPPANQSDIFIQPKAMVDGKEYTKDLIKIDYDHIPLQLVLMPSKSRLVRINLEKRGSNIGYIEGAGDAIPESLEQIGYQVSKIDINSISADYLSQFDAVILGVRAYNTQEDIKFKQKELFKYAENGGNVIVQYNTNRRLKVDEVAPYPIELSRFRVSVEEAPIRILENDHPVMNFPNKITQKDFDNWVQERGLYFPGKWDDKFVPILSSNDPGEEPGDGGLLVADHGKGHFIYTGYSWFRQLPAGVPGAFRIFTNLVSLGSDIKP